MNLLETILDAQGGGAVSQLANQFNLGEGQVKDVLAQLAPALGKGLQANNQSGGGIDALLGALQRGNHQQYLDNPASLADAATTNDGNGILGHILGSKDVSRELASRASSNTGVDSGIIKQLLPLVASLAMGALAKKTNDTSPQQTPQGSQMSDILGSFLDADGDGSAMDDLIGMAGKFLGR